MVDDRRQCECEAKHVDINAATTIVVEVEIAQCLLEDQKLVQAESHGEATRTRVRDLSLVQP